MKLDGERNIPHSFTYRWNIKPNQTNKNKNRLIETETKGMVARGEGGGGRVEKVKGNITYFAVYNEHILAHNFEEKIRMFIIHVYNDYIPQA